MDWILRGMWYINTGHVCNLNNTCWGIEGRSRRRIYQLKWIFGLSPATSKRMEVICYGQYKQTNSKLRETMYNTQVMFKYRSWQQYHIVCITLTNMAAPSYNAIHPRIPWHKTPFGGQRRYKTTHDTMVSAVPYHHKHGRIVHHRYHYVTSDDHHPDQTDPDSSKLQDTPTDKNTM